MDKYDLVFDIVENPDKYSPEQLENLLSDAETREIYNLLCLTESAVKAGRVADAVVPQERPEAKRSLRGHRRFLSWAGSRAAIIAAVVFTSLAAVAVGVAVGVSESAPDTVKEGETEAVAEEHEMPVEVSSAGEPDESVVIPSRPVIFEEATLAAVMDTIGAAYNVDVRFNNREVAELHLYYRFDPSLPLDEIISQLNTFDRIHITRKGVTLNID